jgi:large subunit ribosomal protein L4
MSIKIKIYKQSGEAAGEYALDPSVWGKEYNESLIHQVVVAQMANARQGTKSALTRDEVRGGGKKPWRQKGTGRARQGSIRSPQWKGGGVVFAPKPRDFSKKVNKQAKVIALKSALSQLVAENRLIILDNIALKNNKTKEMVSVLNALKITSALVLLTQEQALVSRACGNIQKVDSLPVNQINLYDILSHDKCVLTTQAVKFLEQVYTDKTEDKA